MDRGRIVERGRHDDLLAAQGLYAQLWTLQREQQAFERLERRLARQPVNLAVLLAGALDTLRAAVDARSVSLYSDVDLGSGLVDGDPLALAQVVQALCQTALDATPDGGRIAVALAREGVEACLTVTDGRHAGEAPLPGGPGSAGALAEPPADPLALRSMVERQGGRLTIEPPAAHRGMRYRITLPLRAVDPAAAPSPEVAANGEAAAPPEPWREDALAGQRVLVVDDLADARDSLALLLETAGAQVVSFGSGHEAIDWLTARPTNEWPQLLVCDLLLGDQEDGHTVMQAIRQLEARRGVDLAQRMPALALSGLARPEGRLRAMLAGFQSHLGKPVGGAQLIETLRRLAGREVAA